MLAFVPVFVIIGRRSFPQVTGHAFQRGPRIFFSLHTWLAESTLVFTVPLRQSELVLEPHEVASKATTSRSVFLLDGSPIDILTAQSLQQQFWSFQGAAREEIAVEGAVDQDIFFALHPSKAHIACDGARAAANLQIYDGSLQRLALGSVRCYCKGRR